MSRDDTGSGHGVTGGVHVMHANTVAVDLAKDMFELASTDDRGRDVERKRLS